jgi:2-polyprenyl-3-methyl-5-hydroxy-6-metoxy-1,4-benzoquinol methylase
MCPGRSTALNWEAGKVNNHIVLWRGSGCGINFHEQILSGSFTIIIYRKRQKMPTEKNRQFYNGIYESAADYQAHYKDAVYFVMWTQALQLLKKIESPRILEIGCGAGQFAHYLFDEGFRNYHGFDFSAEAIQIAQKRVAQTFAVGDAYDPAAYAFDYNVVIAQEILEHLQRDLAVFPNIKPGSRIVFSLPLFDHVAHFRWFIRPREIEKRYYRFVDLQKIVRVADWFVCFGSVQPFCPNFLQRIFKTRQPVNFAFFKHLFREMLPAWIYWFFKYFTKLR